MKKILICIIIINILFLTGCSKEKEYNDELNKYREKVVNIIGKSDNNKIVIKTLNKNHEDAYYVYHVTNTNYIEYLYTFHQDEESYNKAIDNYKFNTYYNLEKYPESYVTMITLEKASKKDNENLYDTIMNKYQDKKNYKIIK